MKSLVLQSDFGNGDGTVSAMYGVAESVSSDLRIYDLTHDIPQFDIWEASYRLIQTVGYWPEGTVFVSVVDPGVGSDRLSVVAKTASGHYIVTPNNGTLTHLSKVTGIVEMRQIDENVNRLPNSRDDYTFNGRDVYAYTGARLASGIISFEDVGPKLPLDKLVKLPSVDPKIEGDTVTGTIDVLDVRFGSLWTNIPKEMFSKLNIQYGQRVELTISKYSRTLYKNILVYTHSFSEVNVGEPLVYINSLSNVAVAINQGSFARAYNIGTGISWKISIRKAPRVVYD